MRLLKSLVIMLVCCVCVPVAIACENAVRDAAFRGPRDMHRLCLITATDDEAAQSERDRLTVWLTTDGAGLNIELAHLCADDPEVEWANYGIPSSPPVLPVVALIGKNYGTSENFVIAHWEPTPQDEDLTTVLHSPVRQQLQEMLGKSLAILLYAPGGQRDEDKMLQIFASVQSTWLAKNLPPIQIVELDRHDPREQTLVSFMGLHPDGPAMAGVVFGRGKLMSPPLLGPEITSKRINELVDQIYQDCNCSKPLPSIGVDLPLVWNEELAKTFVPVSDPATKTEDPRLAALPSMGSFAKTEDSPKATQGSQQPPAPIVTTSEPGNHLVTISLVTLGVVGIFLFLATLIAFRKKPS